MPVTINGTTGIAGVDGSAGTPAVQGADTNTGIFFPAADTVAIATGGSERLRADSSGNVGIGTSSPTSRLHLYGSAPTIKLQHSATGSQGVLRWVDSGGTDRGGIASYYNVADTGNLEFLSGSTTRMTLDSSGNLLVNTSSTINSTAGWIQVKYAGASKNGLATQTTDSTGYALTVYNSSATLVGSVYTNGSTTAFNTSSDYRLKENIQPLTGALSRVAALKPCTYTWKADGSVGEGFIAHELAEVVPDAVTGEKDAVNEDGSIKPQGIDTSFLVATLTAALQEAHGLIKALEQRVAALEAA